MKLTKHFYIQIFLFWFYWVNSRSLFYALFFALLVSIGVYLYQGAVTLNMDNLKAIWQVLVFVFPFSFSLSFITTLLLVFKALFARQIGGYRLILNDCKAQPIEKVLLSDVLPLWRRWLFVTVWLIVLFWVLFIGLWNLVTGELPPLTSFNGVSLYLLVMALGGASFSLGIPFCKKLKVLKDV